MKALIVFSALFAFSASAAVELRGKFDRTTCTIKNNQVVRTQSFGKELKAGFTQVSEISIFGVEDMLAKAETTARPHDEEEFGMAYEATLNGRKFVLHVDDSKEAMYVINIITKACRF